MNLEVGIVDINTQEKFRSSLYSDHAICFNTQIGTIRFGSKNSYEQTQKNYLKGEIIKLDVDLKNYVIFWSGIRE